MLSARISSAAPLLAIGMMAGLLQAQNPIEARAASVTGHAMLTNGSGSPFALTRGFALNPGDRVDTRGGGQVVIDLSDGSMVVVQPESVVVLKDFRAAGSLRELFEITLGRVRVKINHFGGRPNPYRMNSPTASIAVRGTEFSVEVDLAGDTQVVVYEGAVEVTSLSDPNRRVLIEAGRAVVVRPGQDPRPFNPPPPGGRDMGANRPPGPPGLPPQPPPLPDPPHVQPAVAGRGYGQVTAPPQPPPPPPANKNLQPQRVDSDPTSPRAAAGTYERYIAGLAEIGQTPFLLRFNAFPEAHLDSLENPAYAGGFRGAEARLFFLPSFSGTQSYPRNTSFVSGGVQPSTYNLSPQFSLFTPLGGSGVVAGGSLTASRVSSDAEGLQPRISGSADDTIWSGSLLLASRGFGLEIEKLTGSGSLTNTSLTAGRPATETLHAGSDISQTRLTAGVAHTFAGDHTLGVFYRYGFIDAKDADTSHTLDAQRLPLESTRSAGHSAEFGIRLRGPLSRRLLYGIDGSLTGLSLDDALVRAGARNSHQRDRMRRGAVGAGLGYLLTPRVILSVDAAGGSSKLTAGRYENTTNALVQKGQGDSRFASFHGAVQADLSRHLFVTASTLAVLQSRSSTVAAFPDPFGNRGAIGDSFFPIPANPYQSVGKYSDFGIGWRVSPDLFLQYLYSTDYGYTAATHTIMMRYTIRRREK